MVALFSGANESEDWLENRAFDQVLSDGWHLFAQEQLVPVDEARSHGVWRFPQASPAIEKSVVSHAELVRVYAFCAKRAWENGVNDAESVVLRVCDSLDCFAQGNDSFLISDSLRIEWHLKRIDLLLDQWSNAKDPSTGAELSLAFQFLSQLKWPHDQLDQAEKAAFNAVYWWNQSLALSQKHLQKALDQSDWLEAMRMLEFLTRMSDREVQSNRASSC